MLLAQYCTTELDYNYRWKIIHFWTHKATLLGRSLKIRVVGISKLNSYHVLHGYLIKWSSDCICFPWASLTISKGCTGISFGKGETNIWNQYIDYLNLPSPLTIFPFFYTSMSISIYIVNNAHLQMGLSANVTDKLKEFCCR